jgi:hypothetical protein
MVAWRLAEPTQHHQYIGTSFSHFSVLTFEEHHFEYTLSAAESKNQLLQRVNRMQKLEARVCNIAIMHKEANSKGKDEQFKIHRWFALRLVVGRPVHIGRQHRLWIESSV